MALRFFFPRPMTSFETNVSSLLEPKALLLIIELISLKNKPSSRPQKLVFEGTGDSECVNEWRAGRKSRLSRSYAIRSTERAATKQAWSRGRVAGKECDTAEQQWGVGLGRLILSVHPLHTLFWFSKTWMLGGTTRLSLRELMCTLACR